MESFAKIVKDCKLLTVFTKRFILDNSEGFLYASTYRKVLENTTVLRLIF